MADAKHPGLIGESERGLLGIGRKLRSIDAMTRDEYEEVKALTSDVRNPLMHGSIYEHARVWDSLLFCERFIAHHASEVFDRSR